MARPLLILSCSARKRPEQRHLFAFERYDGPAWRVLRAAGWPDVLNGPDCRVVVLSAEYGPISSYAQIPFYDRRLDHARAVELAQLPEDRVRKALYHPVPASRSRDAYQHFPASEVFVWGGAQYRHVVSEWERRGLFDGLQVNYCRGRGIGHQLAHLKAWLRDRKRSMAVAV